MAEKPVGCFSRLPLDLTRLLRADLLGHDADKEAGRNKGLDSGLLGEIVGVRSVPIFSTPIVGCRFGGLGGFGVTAKAVFRHGNSSLGLGRGAGLRRASW